MTNPRSSRPERGGLGPDVVGVELVERAGELVRSACHIEAGSLATDPAVLYGYGGELSALVGRLHDLTGKLATQLAALPNRHLLFDDEGADPVQRVEAARQAMVEASAGLYQVLRAVRVYHSAVAHLGTNDPDPDGFSGGGGR